MSPPCPPQLSCVPATKCSQHPGPLSSAPLAPGSVYPVLPRPLSSPPRARSPSPARVLPCLGLVPGVLQRLVSPRDWCPPALCWP